MRYLHKIQDRLRHGGLCQVMACLVGKNGATQVEFRLALVKERIRAQTIGVPNFDFCAFNDVAFGVFHHTFDVQSV